MIRLLISTGEVSGDLQGSFLIKALKEEAIKRSLELELFAIGGPRMKKEGAYLIADTAPIGAIGLWETLPLIIPTLLIQSKVKKFLKNKPLDAVVLIDYMGPNIRLGNKLKNKKRNLPIIYYIAPQEWAWRLGDHGTTDLISFTDRILAIFQDEADFYSKRGGSVKWVGHPMLDTLTPLPEKEEALRSLGLAPDKKLILLFPASRPQEIKYIMPTLAKTAALLQRKDPSIYVIVPAGLESFERQIRKILDKEGVIGKVISSKKIDSLKPSLFAAASLALGKSGTVNMELALNGVPQIVGYKVSKVTSFIARRVLKFRVEHISPVNLLLKERLVQEFVQEEFNSTELFKYANRLLRDKAMVTKMLDGYKRLKLKLGKPGVTKRAANEILDSI